MEVSSPTSVVKDIVGREPEDFETIARRYIADSSVAKTSVVNRLRALKNFVKVMLTRVPDLETYHHVQGHPTLKNPELCYQNKESMSFIKFLRALALFTTEGVSSPWSLLCWGSS